MAENGRALVTNERQQGDGKFVVREVMPENILMPIFYDGINISDFYALLTRTGDNPNYKIKVPLGLYTGKYSGYLADKKTTNPNDHGYLNLDEADNYDDPLKALLGYHAKKTTKEHTRIYLVKLSETLKSVKK